MTMDDATDEYYVMFPVVKEGSVVGGLCLGQEGTHGKGHEIVAIEALLDKPTLRKRRFIRHPGEGQGPGR